MMMRAYVVAMLALASIESIQAKEAIWIEGEDTFVDNFNRHPWYSQSDLALDLLSPGKVGAEPGDWLSHYANGENLEPAEATYAFDIAEAGAHDIWIRANDHSSGNTFYIDAEEPQPMPRGQNNERINLHVNRAAESGPWIDIRFLDWIFLGSFELETGRHTLTIRCSAATQNSGSMEAHIGIDAIAIVNFPWGPTGDRKPSQDDATTPAADAWFPFPLAEVKEGESAIDVSAVIEAPAGQRGAVRQVGDEYQFEDGTPIKFWGVGAAIPSDVSSMERQAKFFRRMGINLIRLHTVRGAIGELITPEGGGEADFDPQRIERLDRYVAIMKDHGIYFQWSVFWRGAITEADGYPADLYAELPDASGGKNPYGLVNISRALQDIRWRYLEKLLQHVNPHTGLSYADEPALAILEVQNEDCVFFHAPLTALNNPDDVPLHSALFRQQWAQWVKERYDTDEALRAAWGEDGLRAGDSVNADEMALFGAWEMNANGPPNLAQTARLGDFNRFLVDLQTAYWQRRRDEIRGTGFKGVVLSTAWKAGGPGGDASNVLSDSALESIDRHGYWGGFGDRHIALMPFKNDTLMDLSTWYNPEEGTWHSPFARGWHQVENLPYGMSEWSHGTPGEFRAEGGPIYAFYGLGLQGWDSSLHFGYGAHTGVSTSWDFISTYNIANPVQVTQYPALAMAVHQQHISQGAPAAARRFTPEQVFSGVDVFSQPGPWAWMDADDAHIPPQIFALGRMSNAFGAEVGPSERSDWSVGWDQDKKVVNANTGELSWNYGERYFSVRTEKTQGVVGFAGGHRFELPDVKIEVTTPFVSLLVTAMDDRPISESGKVLVTAVAKERWTGSDIEGTGDDAELLALGGPPLMMEPVQATLTFGAEFDSAEALDVHGRRTGQSLTPDDAGAYTIDGRYTTVYYLFERDIEPETANADGSNEMELSMNPADMPSDELDRPDAETGAEGGARARNVSVQGGTDESSQANESGGNAASGCSCDASGRTLPSTWFWTLLVLAAWPRRQRH